MDSLYNAAQQPFQKFTLPDNITLRSPREQKQQLLRKREISIETINPILDKLFTDFHFVLPSLLKQKIRLEFDNNKELREEFYKRFQVVLQLDPSEAHNCFKSFAWWVQVRRREDNNPVFLEWFDINNDLKWLAAGKDILIEQTRKIEYYDKAIAQIKALAGNDQDGFSKSYHVSSSKIVGSRIFQQISTSSEARSLLSFNKEPYTIRGYYLRWENNPQNFDVKVSIKAIYSDTTETNKFYNSHEVYMTLYDDFQQIGLILSAIRENMNDLSIVDSKQSDTPTQTQNARSPQEQIAYDNFEGNCQYLVDEITAKSQSRQNEELYEYQKNASVNYLTTLYQGESAKTLYYVQVWTTEKILNMRVSTYNQSTGKFEEEIAYTVTSDSKEDSEIANHIENFCKNYKKAYEKGIFRGIIGIVYPSVLHEFKKIANQLKFQGKVIELYQLFFSSIESSKLDYLLESPRYYLELFSTIIQNKCHRVPLTDPMQSIYYKLVDFYSKVDEENKKILPKLLKERNKIIEEIETPIKEKQEIQAEIDELKLKLSKTEEKIRRFQQRQSEIEEKLNGLIQS